MKKFTLACVATALSAVCLFGMAACGGGNYEVNKATDLAPEPFGIAVKKGNTEVKAALDAVINEWNENGNMEKYLTYYNELSDEDLSPTAPDGLKLTWNLSSYTETLDMYTESGFAPYEFIQNNGYSVSDGSAAEGSYKVAGLDVAIACEVAEKLQCKLVIHDVAFDDIIMNLNANSGKAIAAAGISITEERQEAVDFSVPYSYSTISVVCAEGAGYSTLQGLNGLKIGVQKGTSAHTIAEDAMKEGGYTPDMENAVKILLSSSTEVVTYETYSAALAALQSGKIDVILMDTLPAQLLIKHA